MLAAVALIVALLALLLAIYATALALSLKRKRERQCVIDDPHIEHVVRMSKEAIESIAQRVNENI